MCCRQNSFRTGRRMGGIGQGRGCVRIGLRRDRAEEKEVGYGIMAAVSA